jgi:hypothetical protein
VEREKPKKSESVGTNFAVVVMETKRGELKDNWIPFIKLHETL